MIMIIIMISAILVLLVVAQITYITAGSHSAVSRPMTSSQYDYYHYIRNH